MAYGVIPAGKTLESARLDARVRPVVTPEHRTFDATTPRNVEREPLLRARDAVVPLSIQRSADGGGEDASTGLAGSGSGVRPATSFKYESLDYEENENIVYRSDQAAQSSLDSLGYSFTKWAICFLIGVITALAAFTVNFGVENISGFKFWAALTVMEHSYFASFLVYASINASLVVAAVLVTLYVGPAAAGSGIAEVKAYLNGVDVPYIFHWNTLLAKVLGAMGSVAGGLAIGKEGPFVHAGAAIAAILCQGGSGRVRLPWLKHFWNDRDRNDMVACGAAAGVAAAFRSPVGGVLFALEEMTTWWRNELLWLAFFTTAVVSVVIKVLMKACAAQKCGFFGAGGFIYIYEIQEGQDTYEVYELLPVLLLGVIGGLLGSGFISLNARLAQWRKKVLAQYGPRGRILEGLALAGLTSLLSFCLPLLVACKDCPANDQTCPRKDNSHSGNFVSFGCSPGSKTYNDLATLFFNTQDDAIRSLFSSQTTREYTVSTLLMFTSMFYVLAILTYGITCPTGLFVPSILCGATYGRLVGIFVADMHPGRSIDEGTYALLGAASFLGGCMRMTVCTCVMLLELTNNMALLPLIMLVLLVAKAVGDGTGVRPVYEVQMEGKELPFMDPSPESHMRHITAREGCGKPPVTFQRVEKVRDILATLQSCTHNGFPVMGRNADGERHIMGVVLRSQLMVLLSNPHCLQASSAVTEASSRVACSFSVSDFSKPLSTPLPALEHLAITPDMMDAYLDLGPYANPSYYVVQEDTSLSKVHQLFRALGLRHVCVIPKAHEVVGLLTRADLMPEVIEQRFDGFGQYTTNGVSIGAHDTSMRSRTNTPSQCRTPDLQESDMEAAAGYGGGGGGSGSGLAGGSMHGPGRHTAAAPASSSGYMYPSAGMVSGGGNSGGRLSSSTGLSAGPGWQSRIGPRSLHHTLNHYHSTGSAGSLGNGPGGGGAIISHVGHHSSSSSSAQHPRL